MAADNVKRTASANPDAHRELVVTRPPMRGRDVANLNRAVRDRLLARGLADDVPTPTHDAFTHAAAVAAVEAQYFIGVQSSTYLKTERVGDDKRLACTIGAQRLVRDPDDRDGATLDRALSRKAQLARGPRYYDDLAEQEDAAGRGVAAALRFARAQMGVQEKPPGSNWGTPQPAGWIRLTGYDSPVPWCGCFANAVVIAGGVPNGRGWIGYTPAIVAHAKARRGGWRWVGPSQGRPGDLALFDTPGGDPAVHVGVVDEQISAVEYRVLEGNTSNGLGGNQAEGHGAFRRRRSTRGTFRIIGFARPPYPA